MTETTMQMCPVCLEHEAYWDDEKETIQAHCSRCGSFRFTQSARPSLTDQADVSRDSGEPRLGPKGYQARANASGWISEHQNEVISSARVAMLASLPTPEELEKAEKLLAAVGAESKTVGPEVNINTPEWYARCWALNRGELQGIVQLLEDQGFAITTLQTTGPGGLELVRVTAEGWENLKGVRSRKTIRDQLDLPLDELVKRGESSTVEFKPAMQVNPYKGRKDPSAGYKLLKAIAGFLNAQGGTLVIGVDDDCIPLGLDADGFENEDKALLHLNNLIRDRIGARHSVCIEPSFKDLEGHRICVVQCTGAESPVFVTYKGRERFFLRTGNSTNELQGREMLDYIETRFR